MRPVLGLGRAQNLNKIQVVGSKAVVPETGTCHRGVQLKRSLTAALILALTLPLTAQQAGAQVSRATAVTTSSKGWVVTLSIARVALLTGSSMSATLTIVNRTGHSVRVPSCETDAIFVVGIGNSSVPYTPVSGAIVCSTTLRSGATVFRESISASYQHCFQNGDKPACGKVGTMPALPPGSYHTVVDWPTAPPGIRKPGILWIQVVSR